jgi:hypothetical protein
MDPGGNEVTGGDWFTDVYEMEGRTEQGEGPHDGYVDITVTFRKVIWLFPEQVQLQFVPVLHGLQGCLAGQGWLRKLLIVQSDVAVQPGFQLFSGMEMVALQHFLYPAVEPLDHAVGSRMLRRGQTVFDAEVGAELIELVLARGRAFAQAEETVGEFLAVIGQNRPDPDRAESGGHWQRSWI